MIDAVEILIRSFPLNIRMSVGEMISERYLARNHGFCHFFGHCMRSAIDDAINAMRYQK